MVRARVQGGDQEDGGAGQRGIYRLRDDAQAPCGYGSAVGLEPHRISPRGTDGIQFIEESRSPHKRTIRPKAYHCLATNVHALPVRVVSPGLGWMHSLTRSSGEGFFDGSRQIFIFKGAVMTLTIDEERWCAVDAAADSTGKIGTHPCPVFAFFQRYF